jgi:demethylmenaquinone methyltransferase/2-methoxy-6-polyprenyl-1,4-benzoquinol methylase
MSTYILMKILESAPHRYDKGISMLTLGRLHTVYDRLVSHIKKGDNILDIGCGTGALTIKAAQKGAHVKGIDVNPGMLEIAQKRVDELHLEHVEFCERGVAELGNENPASYDVVVSGLCFSELTEDELVYTLAQVKRILKPEGLLLAADEVRPQSLSKRVVCMLIRIPLVVVTYCITQTTTHAVADLPKKIKEAGLTVESVTLNTMETFIEVTARKEGNHDEIPMCEYC